MLIQFGISFKDRLVSELLISSKKISSILTVKLKLPSQGNSHFIQGKATCR